MRRHVLSVITIGSVLVSQVASGAWFMTEPPAGTYRAKGSCVIGKGNGTVGQSALFKFGTTIVDPSGTTILNGENEITVTPTAVMPGNTQGEWRTDPTPALANQLAAPLGGWSVSPMGTMMMRIPDHTAGIVDTITNSNGGPAYESLIVSTKNHTVSP